MQKIGTIKATKLMRVNILDKNTLLLISPNIPNVRKIARFLIILCMLRYIINKNLWKISWTYKLCTNRKSEEFRMQ